jgi:hypothetical protein
MWYSEHIFKVHHDVGLTFPPPWLYLHLILGNIINITKVNTFTCCSCCLLFSFRRSIWLIAKNAIVRSWQWRWRQLLPLLFILYLYKY